jgi:hypothetical protein
MINMTDDDTLYHRLSSWFDAPEPKIAGGEWEDQLFKSVCY